RAPSGAGMDRYEAGWNAPPQAPPGGSGGSGGELRASFEGRDLILQPGQVARIGRAPDNELVTSAPTVSRQHAVLRRGAAGWEFENAGSAPTYLNGQLVTQLALDRPLALTLGSSDGPVLRVEPAAAPATAMAPPAGYQAPAGYPPPAGDYPAGDYSPSGYLQQPGYQPPGYQPPGYQPPGRHSASGPGNHDEMATALRILFPIQSWMHDSGWRQGLRVLVIVYALLPLIFLALLSSSGNLTTPGWAYSLYVAPLWIVGFWMLIRPVRVSREEVFAAAGIVVWTLAWMNIVTIHLNDALNVRGSIPFFPALVIGFNEEITKALPVLLAGIVLLKYRKVKLGVRMSMFLGTIAGLTFGVFEQAFYTSGDIVGINQAQSANQAVNAALAFAERIFVDGFQHAVWAGISGFFIGMALNYPRRRVQLIVLGITTAAVLHALNDFLASSSVWLVILIQAASLLLFIGYTMSAASIEERVRESPLFRGDSLILPAFQDPGWPPPGTGGQS
ncbi:MAG TPA: PrsW family glutamic-type intramembrane protease, partial [Trebonia sp.]